MRTFSAFVQQRGALVESLHDLFDSPVSALALSSISIMFHGTVECSSSVHYVPLPRLLATIFGCCRQSKLINRVIRCLSAIPTVGFASVRCDLLLSCHKFASPVQPPSRRRRELLCRSMVLAISDHLKNNSMSPRQICEMIHDLSMVKAPASELNLVRMIYRHGNEQFVRVHLSQDRVPKPSFAANLTNRYDLPLPSSDNCRSTCGT
jgi:hypothetical protein